MLWVRVGPASTSRLKIILGFHLPINPGQVSFPPPSWHCQPREPLLPQSLAALSPCSEPLGSWLEGGGSGGRGGRDVPRVREWGFRKAGCASSAGVPDPGWWWDLHECAGSVSEGHHTGRQGKLRTSLSESWQVLPGPQCGHTVMWTLVCTGSYWGAGSVEELAGGEPDVLCCRNEGQPVCTDSCKPFCGLCGKSGFTCRHYHCLVCSSLLVGITKKTLCL